MTTIEQGTSGTAPPSILPAARAIDLVKTYGKGDAVVHALDGINVEFESGRFTAVMGPSGSGKSTLMHCMAGLDTPTSGRTFVGEREIGQLDDAGLTQMRRDQIGFVFQSFNLVPTLTARENITLPGRPGQGQSGSGLVRLPGRAAQDRRPTVPPSERDVRVASSNASPAPGRSIARPDLVFADEPTGNLDSNSSAEMLAFLRRSVTELQPVDRHGHPRCPGCGLRRPGGLPGRRNRWWTSSSRPRRTPSSSG